MVDNTYYQGELNKAQYLHGRGERTYYEVLITKGTFYNGNEFGVIVREVMSKHGHKAK